MTQAERAWERWQQQHNILPIWRVAMKRAWLAAWKQSQKESKRKP